MTIAALIHRGVEQPPVDCVVVEISNSRARIKVESTEFIPDEFKLVLGENAEVRRRCTVVARGPRELEFSIRKV